MYYPNLQAANFCDWMLNVSEQKLTGPQRIIVSAIEAAAIAAASVTDQQWYNFNLFTAWRFKFFREWQDLQAIDPQFTTSPFVSDWLARLASAGITAPALSYINKLNSAFTWAASQFSFDSCDQLHWFATDLLAQCAVPVINRQANTVVIGGSVSLSAGLGIVMGASGYIDTGYIPLTGSNQMGISSACVMVGTASTVSDTKTLAGCTSSGAPYPLSVRALVPTNSMQCNYNATAFPFITNYSSLGLFGFNAVAGNRLHYCFNGGNLDTTALFNLVTYSYPIYIGALNNAGAASDFSPSRLSFAYIGAQCTFVPQLRTFFGMLQ